MNALNILLRPDLMGAALRVIDESKALTLAEIWGRVAHHVVTDIRAYEKKDALSPAATEPCGFLVKPHSNCILQTTFENAL